MATADTPPIRSAKSLKMELEHSLAQLQRDFDALKHFMSEISCDGQPPTLTISNDELNDLAAATAAIHDAASDIGFEADIIKQKLRSFIA